MEDMLGALDHRLPCPATTYSKNRGSGDHLPEQEGSVSTLHECSTVLASPLVKPCPVRPPPDQGGVAEGGGLYPR